MSVTISKSLYEKILEALPYGEERDELIALTTANNAERSINLTINERTAAHFAHSLRVGAVTAKMCDAHPESVKTLRQAADAAESLIPEFFSAFLHSSDVEKMIDMMVYQNGKAVAKGRWGTAEIFIERPGKRSWQPSMKNFRDLPVEDANALVEQMNDFASRCAVLDDPESDMNASNPDDSFF